jgi:hypothetical protein
VSALGAFGVALFAIFKYTKDRNDAREKQQEENKRRIEDRQAEREQHSEERFQAVVEGLSSDRVEAQIGAAVTLRIFLQANEERFYQPVFDLAAAHLRLPKPPERAQEAADALTSVLATVLVESFPLARGELATEEEKPKNWELARPIWHVHRYLDAKNIVVPGVTISAVDLRYATLDGAILSSTTMSGSDLSGAHMDHANFSNAYLLNAKLTGAQCSNATFTGAYLGNADLTGANLTGANLTGANPQHAASLERTSMRYVTGLTTSQRAACKAKGALLDDETPASEVPAVEEADDDAATAHDPGTPE